MKVKLSITLDVDAVEDKGALADTPRVLRSVREGIEYAIRYGQGEGFVHELSDDVSIMLVEVGEAIEEPAIRKTDMTAVLNNVLDTKTKLTANVEIKADGIFLSVGERVVALLENKSGTPQIVVYADALRDEPTHVIPIPGKTPCIRVEYDEDGNPWQPLETQP